MGQHIASESENFLIAGANYPESHIAMIRYCRKLVSDIAHTEKSYSLPDSNFVLRFTFELVPSDMNGQQHLVVSFQIQLITSHQLAV